MLVGVFVLVERRAMEPVLPLHLFRLRAFSVTSLVGFIVGFAMFGAITYLPAFFQVVRGISPTISGVQLLPLMAGLLVVSIGSGQMIAGPASTGSSRSPAPAMTTLGLYLLSLMGVHTSSLLDSLYMLVLGMGIGGVMQVLVIIVQNAVPHSELGVATSGATFFRSIGGSFGTAIFGAIFSNVLIGNLASHLHGVHLPAGLLQRGRHAGPARRTCRRRSTRASWPATPSRSRRCSSWPCRSPRWPSSPPGSSRRWSCAGGQRQPGPGRRGRNNRRAADAASPAITLGSCSGSGSSRLELMLRPRFRTSNSPEALEPERSRLERLNRLAGRRRRCHPGRAAMSTSHG